MVAKQKKTPLILPHQKEGTAFLRNRTAAALFDEQGLGKSKQLIDAIAGEIQSGSIEGAVIVCPNGLKTNWADEIERFSTLPFAVFGSGQKARRMAFSSLKASFYVINYESVAGELPSLKALLRFKPMALVLDESHRIKTPAAKVTKAVLELRSAAARRYLLSGTPVANKPEDLWSQIFFLDDGKALGATFESFEERYRAPGGGYAKVDELRDYVSRMSLRRLKDHAVKLPPKTFKRVGVKLSGTQKKMYETLRDEMELWVTSLSGQQVVKNTEAILARLVRLAQVASNPRLLDKAYKGNPAKFQALDGILIKLLPKPKQKVIIWSSFVENISELKDRYRKSSPVVLHGEMSTAQRDKSVRAFRNDPSVRLLIANPAAAREGLTLTEANVAIYLDRTFNLVDYLQSQDRIHRISQARPCEIILLLAEDTIDSFIDFSLEQKHRLARYTQRDAASVAVEDLALEKPELLRALLVGKR